MFTFKHLGTLFVHPQEMSRKKKSESKARKKTKKIEKTMKKKRTTRMNGK